MDLGAWKYRSVFEISQTELALQDLAINIDELTELQDASVFRLKRGTKTPALNDDDLIEGV